MNNETLESIFQKAAVYLAAVLSGCIGLAIFGHFTKQKVAGVIIIAFLLLVAIIIKGIIRKNIKISRADLIILAVILGAVLSNGFFHHDLAFGRDNMGYLAAGVKITESGSLSFQDIITRPYHPFRNLGNDVFTSQFMPAYNVYLAIFYIFGSLPGIFWANALLLFFTLAAIYFIGKRLASRNAGLLAALLAVTHYVTIWFTRRTLSESLLMFLFWCGTWLILAGYRDKRAWLLGSGLFIFSLTPLVRSEGLIYLVLSFLVFLFLIIKDYRKNISDWGMAGLFTALSLINVCLFMAYGRRYGDVYIQYGWRMTESFLNYAYRSNLIAFGLIFAVVLVAGYLIYKKLPIKKLKQRINFRYLALTTLFLAFIGWEINKLAWLNDVETFKWSQYKFQYVLENFWYYLLIPYVLIAYCGLYKKVYSKSVFYLLVLAAPSFVFIIEPSIAVDQPWFMRRFFPIFIPLILLLASVAVASLTKLKNSFFALTLMLLIVNMSISWPIATFQEYKGVQPQLSDLSSRFKESDLVLMDPGWHWQQWGYALHYIYGLDVLPNLDGFSQEEFSELLNNYENIYVMSDEDFNIHDNFEDINLTYVFNWSLKYDRLERTSWIASYIDDYKSELELKVIRVNQEGTPPREISEVSDTYNIFKVVDKSQVIWN